MRNSRPSPQPGTTIRIGTNLPVRPQIGFGPPRRVVYPLGKSLPCLPGNRRCEIQDLRRSLALRSVLEQICRYGLRSDSGRPGEWYTLSENLYRAYLVTGDAKFKTFAAAWHYDPYWNKFAGTASDRIRAAQESGIPSRKISTVPTW